MKSSEAQAQAQTVLAASRDHLVRTTAAMQKLMGRNAVAVGGDGAELRLSDGRTVLDLGTWAATVTGHRHPAVVTAVRGQLDALPAAARGFASAPAPMLAQRLVEFAQPSRLERVWFGANGADVVEAALKLARVATGKLRVLAVMGGFHGRTLGAVSVSHADRYHEEFQALLGGVTFIEVHQDAVAKEVEAGDVAAVIFEIVQGRGTVIPLPAEVLRQWSADAHRAGAFVIVDEIQTALWRCGSYSLALELALDPDAVLFGKALGGGVVPLSALVATPSLLRPLETSPYLHSQTFAGHPLSCAAGLATLEVLPTLAEMRLPVVEQWLASLRLRLLRHEEFIAAVDGMGLMLGITFRRSDVAQRFAMAAARDGVLLWPCDGDREVVRVMAPLVLTDAQMVTAANVLDGVLAGGGSWLGSHQQSAPT